MWDSYITYFLTSSDWLSSLKILSLATFLVNFIIFFLQNNLHTKSYYVLQIRYDVAPRASRFFRVNPAGTTILLRYQGEKPRVNRTA